MLLDLFITFLMVGCVSFGGGYAMIPLIEREVTSHGWMTTARFADIIAVAGMSPGPMATNSAIFVGYETSGIPGAIVAALGTVLPSFILVVLATIFFYKMQRYRWVKSAFYGLRPTVTALIIFSAYLFGQTNGMIGPLTKDTLFALLVFGVVLLGLTKYRMHPVAMIVLSGLVGVAFYS